MKKMVCLLIDDDQEELEIFRFALEDVGQPVQCDSAKSGREALHYLAGKPVPDYIFLDMNMPTMDGKQCLAAIRKMCDQTQVPVILYSSTFLDEQKRDLLKLGASGFLTKAATVTDLRRSLENLFEGSEDTQLRQMA